MFTIVNGKLDLGEFELAIDFDTIGTLPTWNVLLQLGMSGSLLQFLNKVQIMEEVKKKLFFLGIFPK